MFFLCFFTISIIKGISNITAAMHRTKRSNPKPFVYFEPMCTSKYPASEHKRERQTRFIFSFFSSGDEVLSALTSEIIPEIKATVSPSTHITKTTRQILTVINKLIDFFRLSFYKGQSNGYYTLSKQEDS